MRNQDTIHGNTAGTEQGGAVRVALLGEVSKRPTPSSGGTGINLIRLGNALLADGLSVHVIMARLDHLDNYGECLDPGIPRIAIGRQKRLLQSLALLRYLLRHRPDLLVTQDSRAMDLAMTACRLLPRPPRLICVIHNERVVRLERNPVKERHKLRRFQRVVKQADALVGVSPGLFQAVARRVDLDGLHTEIIPSPGYHRPRVESALAAPVPRPDPGSRHVVCAGRLSPEKNQSLALRAFAAARAQGLEAHLTLLGEGQDRPRLEGLIRELGLQPWVHLPGFVSNPMAYMADADLLVHACVQEAFGIVLVEALSVGVPVVSTDCPYGPRYILQDGRHGRLVPMGDAPAMTRAMLQTLANPPSRHVLMGRARDFDSATMAKRYLALFREVLSVNGQERSRGKAGP